jgi:hypothetical protein
MKNIIEQINNLSESDLVALNNTYCNAMKYDSYIYENEDEILNAHFHRPSAAIIAANRGIYSYSDNCFRFDGNGNLYSFNMNTDRLCESVEKIAKYISENPTDFEHLIKIEE